MNIVTHVSKYSYGAMIIDSPHRVCSRVAFNVLHGKILNNVVMLFVSYNKLANRNYLNNSEKRVQNFSYSTSKGCIFMSRTYTVTHSTDSRYIA